MNFPKILSDLLKEPKLLLNLNFFRIIVTSRYHCMSLSLNEQISIQHCISLDNYFDNISIRSDVAKLLWYTVFAPRCEETLLLVGFDVPCPLPFLIGESCCVIGRARGGYGDDDDGRKRKKKMKEEKKLYRVAKIESTYTGFQRIRRYIRACKQVSYRLFGRGIRLRE